MSYKAVRSLRSTMFQNSHSLFREEMPVFIRRSLMVVAKFSVLSNTRRSALIEHEQIIERTDNRDYPVAAHCTGKVEQYDVIRYSHFFLKRPSVRYAAGRRTADDRISLFL